MGLFLIGAVAFGGYTIKSEIDQQEAVERSLNDYIADFNKQKFAFNELSRLNMGLNEDENNKTCPYYTRTGSECMLSEGADGEYIIQEYERKHGEKTPTDYYVVVYK